MKTWFTILKAEWIRENPAMNLARKLVIPYIEGKIQALPSETLTLPEEGQEISWHRNFMSGRRLQGVFFNDVEVNTWLGEDACKQLVFSNEEWTKLAAPIIERGHDIPYPYNRDPVLDGGQCNIQAAEFIMEAIVQRLPDHKVTIDVEPLGWQGEDNLSTRLNSTRNAYQCGFKYRYIEDTTSRMKGTIQTGKVKETKDEDTTLW